MYDKHKVITLFSILSLLCFSLITSKVFAVNVDSLLIKHITIPKPYLVINITSTECITCRGGAVNILTKLPDSLKKKIIILSDDKNMSFYFNKNQHIYSGYTTIYDKELSAALALGPSATACLCQDNGEHKYFLTMINDDTISYLKQVLWGQGKQNTGAYTYTRFKIKDSVFTNPTNLSFGGNKALLFNEQFQVGLQLDLVKNTIAYMQPQFNDSTIETLNWILKNDSCVQVLNRIVNPRLKKITDVKYARQISHDLGIDQITIYGLNMSNNSLAFKQYLIHK